MPTTHSLVEAFWVRAVNRLRLNEFEVVTGPEGLAALTPPAWTLEEAEGGDGAVAGIVAGDRTALSGPPLEEEPERGTLSILTWADGSPAALVETEGSATVAFGDVDDELARADGQADAEQWRATARPLFAGREAGTEPSDETPVLFEFLKVALRAS